MDPTGHETDLIDPATEDWTAMDDAECWHAAQAGVPQAVAELARRERADRSTS